MHNQSHLINVVSRSVDVDYDLVHIIYLYGTVESIKEKIVQNQKKFILLLGQDFSSRYTDALDDWEYLDTLPYRMLVLDLDYLLPERKVYKRINRVWYNQNCLSNIEVLLMHQPIMEVEYNPGPWLSLMRSTTPLRKHTFENWISRYKEHFVFSYGPDQCFGDINFYDNPKNCFGPDMINNNNFLSLLPEYNRCGGSIVNETCGDYTMTEKTFQAIMAGHPILVVGIKGSVSYLRDHGFDMFDDMLDHSYDSLDASPARVDKLFNDNKDIITAKLDRREFIDRLEHNRQNLTTYRNHTVKKMIDDIKNLYRGK